MRLKAETNATPIASSALRMQRKCACGGYAGASGECEKCHTKRLEQAPPTAGRGHDFGRLRVRRATGELEPGTNAPTPAPEIQPAPVEKAEPLPGGNDAPQRLDTTPAAGPAITVTNGWSNPAGDTDRTTVGIGELTSFVVSDVAGGSWKSADGKGKTNNSVSFQWTASAKGTNVITYTAADKSVSKVTMTTEVPDKLTGKKDTDSTYPSGTQGAGMDLTVTVHPTTVSFQALEIMEGTVAPSALSGFFTTHTPPSHDAAHGAGTWNGVGPDNDVPDNADSNGWSSPWAQGSYTWAIPTSWRLKTAKTSTAFAKTSDQVVDITGADGTTIVSKLGAKTKPRKP
jgi:hypothetical protein